MTRQDRIRTLLGSLLLAAAITTPAAHASEPWTSDDTLAALEGSPEIIDCVVRLESQYQPYAIGSAGELGVAQLLPTENGGGQMAEFMEGDWTVVDPADRSPFDPELSVAYLNFYLDTHGDLAPWSTWRPCGGW